MMKALFGPKTRTMYSTLDRLLTLGLALWTALVAGMLAWHLLDTGRLIEHIAHEAALENIEIDVLYRQWADEHGGIYVPVPGAIPPNRPVKNAGEHDIATSSGMRLTLINPASLTRQVHEMEKRRHSVQGHITSLNPIRQENRADDWERKALDAIAAGRKDFGEIVMLADAPHYRLMVPLFVQEACLKCHAAQGYRAGDLRGGISAAVPIQKFEGVSREHTASGVRHFAAVWLLGAAGMLLIGPYIRKRIDEREEAIARVRDSEQRMRSVVDNAPFGAHLYRLEPDGRLLLIGANAAADRILGFENSRLVGGTVEEAFPALRGTDIPDRYRQVAATGRPVALDHVDYEDQAISGAFEVHAVPTAPQQVAVFFRDITERKQAEEQLRRSEEQFRLLLNSTGEAIYGIDRQGTCTFCNPSGLRLLGYQDKTELLGRNMHELMHHTRKDGSFYPLDECKAIGTIISGAGAHVTDEVFWRSDGTSFPVEYWSYPQLLEGKIVGAVVTFVDITARVHLEERIRQIQKMEAIGTLAGGVAHDFNNILTAIIGYAHLLKMDKAPHEHRTAAVDGILSASERAAHLTHGLLAFSRKQVIQRVTLDLNDLIREFQAMIGRLLKEDVELCLRCSRGRIPVAGDKGQLEQVLMNLVTNARDAMPRGGQILITTGITEIDSDSTGLYQVAGPGTYGTMTVSDTGQGMDADTIGRVFEPFFTTKEVGKGTGLGLSIVYGIIKKHNGSVTVSSEPGKGATISIYLPLARTETAAIAVIDDPVPPSGTERILLVEDDDAMRTVTREILARFGYTILEAVDGAQALRMFRENMQDIKLIITDVVMPNMNGRQLHQEAKKLLPEVRCLFFSGYDRDTLPAHEMGGEIIHFLQKPLKPKELLAKVREMLDSPV